MSTASRVRKNRNHLNHPSHPDRDRSTGSHLRLHHPPETHKVRGNEVVGECGPDVYLMVNVQPLSRLPWWAQQVIRWIYFRYGWCASVKTESGDYLSLEYRGVTPDEAEARYLSSEPNASYTKVPWRSCLAIETGQYGTHDFPFSESSHRYRGRELPFVQVPRERMAQLERKVEEVFRSASA